MTWADSDISLTNIADVCYSNNMFLVMSSFYETYSSSDGKNWNRNDSNSIIIQQDNNVIDLPTIYFEPGKEGLLRVDNTFYIIAHCTAHGYIIHFLSTTDGVVWALNNEYIKGYRELLNRGIVDKPSVRFLNRQFTFTKLDTKSN